METVTQTMTAPADLSSSEAEDNFKRSYMGKLQAAKEAHDIRRFGLIKFEDYTQWVLDNQLPLR